MRYKLIHCTDIHRLRDFILRGLRPHNCQIIPKRAAEQKVALRHIGKHSAGAAIDLCALRFPPQIQRAAAGLKNSKQQFQQRTLADAGRAGNNCKSAFGKRKLRLLQNLIAVIGKAEVFSLQRLNIRVQFRRIFQRGRRFALNLLQFHQSLSRCDHGHILRQYAREIDKRRLQLVYQLDDGCQRAKGHLPLQHLR